MSPSVKSAFCIFTNQFHIVTDAIKVSKVVNVNEGTIYPLLKSLTNEKYFETYLRESTEGPPRKYYHLTSSGTIYMEELREEWDGLQEGVNSFLKEHGYE